MNKTRSIPIKFRAISIPDRTRVTGFYYHDELLGDCLCNNIRRDSKSGHAYCDFWRVDPDSVEQLAGFDDYGNELYSRKASDSFAQYPD